MTRPLYAKSARPGRAAELLTDHLDAALRAATELRGRVGEIIAGAAIPDGFWTAVAIAAVSHDLGKVADGFQDMVTGRTRSWGHRHEVLSLGFLPAAVADDDLRLWVACGVVTHHRPLTSPLSTGTPSSIASQYAAVDTDDLTDELGPIADDAVRYLHGWLAETLVQSGLAVGGATLPPDHGAALVSYARQELDRILDRWEFATDPASGLTAVLVQGAVTLADHLSSAHGVLHTTQPIGTGLHHRLADRFAARGGLRDHQHTCAATDGHLLLRSPTGSGKTEAGLLWAARQVTAIQNRTGGVPRVFLTLPYLASINAMATRLGTLLGGRDLVGIAHSRAASYHLAIATGTDDTAHPSGPAGPSAAASAAARKAVSRAAATRLFQETVRVATPYQLLRAALAGPAHSSILIDVANSVVLLDELHAYDPRRLGYILASTGLWERLGCRVAILSATLSTALTTLVADTLTSPLTTVTGPAGPARHRVQLRSDALTDPAIIADIIASLRANRSVLVVANNVAHAQELFTILGPVACDLHGENAAMLLHARFTRRDRMSIEQRLTERFGTSVDPRRPGLLVATQVVEVSLDIDLDILFTAGAPLEALLQRFGRVNRLGTRPPADVVVCQPRYGPRRGDPAGRWADGIYPAEPVEQALAILDHHGGQPVDEDQATGWLDDIYASPWGTRWKAEVIERRDAFTRDFLTFRSPFEDRSDLEDRFDELFDGTEAILEADRPAYAERLGTAPHPADRLLGEEYLIPLPPWASRRAVYDKHLRVHIIDGDYDPDRGLTAARPVNGVAVYQPGEVL